MFATFKEISKMEISAGLAVVYKEKLLLVHPTKQSWKGTYSIPKGKIDKGEEVIDAAIRETWEETGIKVPKSLIGKQGVEVRYKKKNRTYKKVLWFPVLIDELSQIGIDKEIVDKDKLALDEVDWAGFLGKKELKDRIFWRFLPIAEELKLI